MNENNVQFYVSGLAIFIACLGLLGLISYTAGQRTKEIEYEKYLVHMAGI